jgi:cytochrome c biogenesis protein CcmG/thiol:disulfide interchange protein DsbE
LSKRIWILLGTGLPVLALLGLLGWGSLKSSSGPSGVGVNQDFGQVDVTARPAARFTLESMDGETLNLADLQGKVVLVDFWASWCTPCRQEAPVLRQVYQEYADQPVEFVGVNIWDRREDAFQYIDTYNIPYPNGIDESGSIAIDYGVRGIPEKFFIDSTGVVRRKYVGPMHAETLRAALDELLPAQTDEAPTSSDNAR